ncbi:MAG: protein translocase subunit SecF [Gammaproteobacteria bacterium]|nr:protein translocase subunit SecF [Gammaproteobacteria bacterium]
MRLLSDTHIDFIGKRRFALGLSILLILVSFASLVARGLNWGLDFTGGVLIEVAYDRAVELDEVRTTLAEAGYADAVVQNFGTSSDVLIRLPPVEAEEEGAELSNEVGAVLRAADPSVQLRRNEFVGPQVGEDLAEQGSLAMLFAMIMIFAYVMLRFRWKFAVGAIVAIVHDVIITVGLFSIFQFPFDLTVLAAVLAVIGYSLNDTVVIYDRIRENFRAIRRGTTAEIVNVSLNQTLSRTVVTALTTLLVLFALLFLAGETLFGFSMALIVGVLIGTYSSVYVSGAALVYLNVAPSDLVPVRREEIDEMP